MKKYSLIFFFQLLFMSIHAQSFNNITFDTEDQTQQIKIDTSNSNNIWQIGSPQKSIFNNAISSPNVIVTDTINPYSINNTSTFEIIHYGDFNKFTWSFLSFSYQIDTDSLNDYGYIECSIDGGEWINLLDTTAYFSNSFTRHTFTGTNQNVQKVNELTPSTFLLAGLDSIWDDYYHDSVSYRFVFVSDNIETNQEGWLIDNIELRTVMSLSNIDNNIIDNTPYNIYPNPTKGNDLIQIGVQGVFKPFIFSLYSISGQILLKKEITSPLTPIDISSAPKGICIYHIQEKNSAVVFSDRIVVN